MDLLGEQKSDGSSVVCVQCLLILTVYCQRGLGGGPARLLYMLWSLYLEQCDQLRQGQIKVILWGLKKKKYDLQE